MADSPEPYETVEPDQLRFDRVEPVTTTHVAPGIVQPTCVACRRPIADQYYAAGKQLVCPACREAYLAHHASGSRVARFLKATLLGVGAGLVGATVWFAVRKLTGYEIGLIAVGVGLLVGAAVRTGSNRRGGRGYQVLAVLLTYFAICANYMPDVAQAMYSRYQADNPAAATGATPPTATTPDGEPADPAPVASPTSQRPAVMPAPAPPRPSLVKALLGLALLAVIVFVISLAAPFLAGAQNLIGLLIIGFALWEAWKINSGRSVRFAGPYSLTGAGTPNPITGAAR